MRRAVRTRRWERGAVLVWATFAVVMVTLVLAAAINVGHLATVRGEHRNAADAAALAGVMQLDGTPASLARAVDVAVAQAGVHPTDRLPVSFGPEDVELGRWTWTEPAAAAFHGIGEIQASYPGDASEVARRVTAVRVRAHRDAVPHVFAGLLDRDAADVAAGAVAAGGGPCRARCPLPFTIADCHLPSRCGSLMYLRASPDGSDLMSFTVLSGSQATSPGVNDVLQGIISGNCPVHREGEVIRVNNGNFFSPIQADFQRLIDVQSPDGYWVPVTTGYDCANPKFTGDHPVSGFARMRLERIVVSGSDKHIEATYLCDLQGNEPGGCIYYGTHARPMLVR